MCGAVKVACLDLLSIIMNNIILKHRDVNSAERVTVDTAIINIISSNCFITEHVLGSEFFYQIKEITNKNNCKTDDS